MCLRAKSDVARGHKAPGRRIAYKIVTKGRRAVYRSSYERLFKYLSVHSEDVRNIQRGRRGTEYTAGIHVFTTLKAARWKAMSHGAIVVKVAVNKADWFADGDRGDALYSEIKVLGRIPKKRRAR